MKRIYLCGGINGLSDEDATDWREAVKDEFPLQFGFLDPMRRDYRGKEAESVNEIVNGDLVDIINSDIILVNATKPSWGTAMEVFFAAGLGKCVITVCPDEEPSPWLVKHSDIMCWGFEEAFANLEMLA